MNAPHPQSHEARLIAARRFIEADAVLTQAMRDGINFHGAVSGMVAAEDELRAAMSEHPAGVEGTLGRATRPYDDPGPECNLCHDTGDVRNRYGEFTGRCSCTSARETAELIELARSGADDPGLEPGETGRRIAAGVESCPAHPMGERRAR